MYGLYACMHMYGGIQHQHLNFSNKTTNRNGWNNGNTHSYRGWEKSNDDDEDNNNNKGKICIRCWTTIVLKKIHQRAHQITPNVFHPYSTTCVHTVAVTIATPLSPFPLFRRTVKTTAKKHQPASINCCAKCLERTDVSARASFDARAPICLN